MARAMRLGYNVLVMDSDVIVFDDPYRYLKVHVQHHLYQLSQVLCKLLYPSFNADKECPCSLFSIQHTVSAFFRVRHLGPAGGRQHCADQIFRLSQVQHAQHSLMARDSAQFTSPCVLQSFFGGHPKNLALCHPGVVPSR